ncbi:MAG TPA: ABC transporter transmembrane domain-containing protein [Anaeromyxobacteraceae bacterium]|nr:ABC transporter transmembrane domain-containing protein [Anaeromyxobacteraceae bacterium]
MGTPASRGPTLRRIVGLARPELSLLALGTVALAVGSAAALLYPQAIRIIIDGALGTGAATVLGPAGPAAVNRAAVAMAALALVQGVAIAFRARAFGVAGERVVTRLRRDLYRAILDQEVAFFDERRTGELTSRLASDSSVLQSAVSANVSMGLRHLATAAGAVGFLFFTSARLALVMLAVVPAVAVGAVVYGRRVRRLAREVQDALAAAGEVAEESIAGIRTVRSFDAEGREVERYGRAVWRAFETARRRIRAGAAFMGSAAGAGYGAIALVLWYGGRLVSGGHLSAGGLTGFLVYTLVLAMSLGALADLWADFMKALGAAERIFEIQDRVPRVPVQGGAAPARVEGRIAWEGVRFAYPARRDLPVLQGIDLAVDAGEVVALVGPSGAGKSTLAQLLSRFYDPDEGRILLDGRDLRELDPRWLRRQIGVVSQEPILFSGTVADNVRYGRPDASDAEVEAAARAANAHEFVARFPDGYATRVGERGVQLSGGQKQRVAIARAVLKDPRVLVLDEATSALDAESEHLVQEALERLMRGRTTLIIAHRLSTVVGADRVVVLDGGRIAQLGSHATLMAEDGPYRRLVERQFVAA